MKKFIIPLLAATMSIACQDSTTVQQSQIAQSQSEKAVIAAAKTRNNDQETLDRIENLKKELAKDVAVNSSKSVAEKTVDTEAIKSVEEVLGAQPDVAVVVADFIKDKADPVTKNTTRSRITRVMSETFGLSEFKNSEPTGTGKSGYVAYDKILPIIKQSISWQRIGNATDQNVLDRALEHANNGGLAIAIDTSVTYGHVVMVLPGDAVKSGSWNLQLPKVLSLSNHKPENSFHDKSLAYAFKKSDAVEIYIEKKY